MHAHLVGLPSGSADCVAVSLPRSAFYCSSSSIRFPALASEDVFDAMFFLEGVKIRLLLDVSVSVLSLTRLQSFPILNYQSLFSLYWSTFSITNRQSIFSTIGIDIFDHQFFFFFRL